MALYTGAPELRYGTGYFRQPVIMTPPKPSPFSWVNPDWENPTPIYCMRSNPYIQNIQAQVCKPNKAAIAEMAKNFKPLPNGDVIIKAENGNGETVEIAVNGNGEIVAERKAPNFVPIAIAGAILFAVLGG